MALRDIFKGSSFTIKDSYKKSLDWLNDMISNMFGKTNDNTTRTDDETEKRKMNFKGVNTPMIGKLYFFMYHDPIHKATLPYYDKFPIVIPIEYVTLNEGSGMMGLNLHYLPPVARATLLDALVLELNDENYEGEQKRLKINYQILKSFMGNYPDAKVCIKKYSLRRIFGSSMSKGKFNEIHPDDWKFVVMLPSLHEWVRNPNYTGPLPW